MIEAVSGGIAIALVAGLCYSAPKRSLTGFAAMRLPLLGIAAAAFLAACIFPDKGMFIGLSSASASLAVITFGTLLMAHAFEPKSVKVQNSIAAFAYPLLVLTTAIIAYLIGGSYAACGGVFAGVLLVVCVYARSAVLAWRRQNSRSAS